MDETKLCIAAMVIDKFYRLIVTSSIWNIRHYSERSTANSGRTDDPQSSRNVKNREKKAEVVGKRKEKMDDGRRLKPQGWISRILTGPQGVAAHYLQSHSSLLSDSDFIYELVSEYISMMFFKFFEIQKTKHRYIKLNVVNKQLRLRIAKGQ